MLIASVGKGMAPGLGSNHRTMAAATLPCRRREKSTLTTVAAARIVGPPPSCGSAKAGKETRRAAAGKPSGSEAVLVSRSGGISNVFGRFCSASGIPDTAHGKRPADRSTR
jgi:hypothetical protein